MITLDQLALELEREAFRVLDQENAAVVAASPLKAAYLGGVKAGFRAAAEYVRKMAVKEEE